MALRKASAYSKKRVVPYTRTSKQKGKAYIKTIPPSKIVKFSMGKEQDFKKGKLPYVLSLAAFESAQIRDNALEACRQYINKRLDETFSGQYFFRVVPSPHHIQRENKMLTGAGADRMQTGMSLSFGKSIGRAALLKPGDKIFSVAVANSKSVQLVRKILREVKPKLPCYTKVVYEEIKK